MKATLTSPLGDEQEIEFERFTSIKFHFGEQLMDFIEVSAGQSWDGKPCLDLRAGRSLAVEPSVSNHIKVRMTDR